MTPSSTSSGEEESTKRALQRQIGRTRQSLSDTVEEIKETAEQGYASVKETVSGVLDYRDQFQKDPLVWSLGALSAGFALGYTVGYGHKSSKRGGKHSQAVQFADRMINELSTVGQSLLMPALGGKIKEFFGFDFTEFLEGMRGGNERPKTSKRTRSLKAPSRSSKRKSQRSR
jgi:hypothetical protein